MTLSVAYGCVLVAALLPYVWVAIAKAGGARYDNRNPRAWLARQDNPRLQRATAAQLNSFEAFPAFAAGVILAQLAGLPHERIATLAVAFVILRILHGVFYVLDRAALRSLVWFGALGCVIALIGGAAIRIGATAPGP